MLFLVVYLHHSHLYSHCKIPQRSHHKDHQLSRVLHLQGIPVDNLRVHQDRYPLIIPRYHLHHSLLVSHYDPQQVNPLVSHLNSLFIIQALNQLCNLIPILRQYHQLPIQHFNPLVLLQIFRQGNQVVLRRCNLLVTLLRYQPVNHLVDLQHNLT